MLIIIKCCTDSVLYRERALHNAMWACHTLCTVHTIHCTITGSKLRPCLGGPSGDSWHGPPGVLVHQGGQGTRPWQGCLPCYTAKAAQSHLRFGWLFSSCTYTLTSVITICTHALYVDLCDDTTCNLAQAANNAWPVELNKFITDLQGT